MFGLISLQLMGAGRLCDACWYQPADIWMNDLTQNPKSGNSNKISFCLYRRGKKKETIAG